MSAIELTSPVTPTAPPSRSGSPASESETGFAAMVDGADTRDVQAQSRPTARSTAADASDEAPPQPDAAGLLNGAAVFIQIPVALAPTAVTTASPLASPSQGAGGSPATPTSTATITIAAAPTPAAPSAPATTAAPPAQATAGQAETPHAKTPAPATPTQAATAAVELGLLTMSAKGAAPTDPTIELQNLLQDGARRAAKQNGDGVSKPSAKSTGDRVAPGLVQAAGASAPNASLNPGMALGASGGRSSLADALAKTDAAPTGTTEAAATGPAVSGRGETAPDAPPALNHAPAIAAREAASGLSRATIETTAQIAAQILRRLEGRATRFEMALTPEGLGRVDVSLDINADGRLAARLAFDNPAAALDLRGRADELRRQLEEAGFQLAGDALDFSERDPSAGQGFDRRSSRAFAGAAHLNAETDVIAATPARWLSLTLTPSGVDMKV